MTQSRRRRTPGGKPPGAGFQRHGLGCGAGEARAWTRAAHLLVLVFLAGVIAMIAGPHRIGDNFTESDFYGAYAEGARLLQHGQLLPARYGVVGPGYELALALVGWGLPLFLAAQLLSALASAATVLLWFHLLRRRLDARYGIACALVLVTNDFFFRFAFAATTDAFANALQAAALFVLLGASGAGEAEQTLGSVAAPPPSPATRLPRLTLGPGSRRCAAAGLLAALAFLTRYNAIYLLPAALLAILAGTSGAPRRRGALLFTAGFLLPVLPWVLFSLAHGGSLALQLHHNIAYEVFARSRGIPWDTYQKTLQAHFPTLASVIARDPAAVFARMARNVFEHLRNDAAQLLGWPLAVAALGGLGLSLREGSLRPLGPLLVAGALLFLTLVPAFYSERYSLALLPLYATLGAAAFASPRWAGVVGHRPRLWLKALLLPLIVALALPASVAKQRRALEQLPTEVLEVGRTLRRLRQPGDRVIARKAHIGYYGDCRTVAFPFADSLAQLARYARDAHARWMFFSWPEAETRPAFWYLLDTSGVVPGLTPRHVTSPRPAVLYEIGPEFGRRPDWFANDTLFTWHTLRGRSLVDLTDAKLQAQFGWLSWWLGRLPEARDALLRAAALDPSRAGTYATLGRVLLGLNEPETARRSFARALQLTPGDADARMGYGLAAFLTGRDREAGETWRPVISLTADPRILRAMAQLYDSLGDREAAAQARDQLEHLPRR